MAAAALLTPFAGRFNGAVQAAESPPPTPPRAKAQQEVLPPPCNLSLTGTALCKGVVNNDFLTTPTRKKLDDAVQALTDDNSDETYRNGDCGNTSCQYAQYNKPFISTDSRHMDLALLPKEVGVLVGAMKFAAREPSDVYYGLGGDLENDGDKRRAFVVVTSTTDRSARPGGHVIARWTLYGSSKATKLFGPLVGKDGKVRTGFVVKCDNHHKKDKPYASSFLSCESAATVEAYAKRVGISFAAARHVLTCQGNAKEKATSEKCQAQRVAELKTALKSAKGPKLMSFNDAVKLLPFVEADPLNDPYWFSCSLGCCTASM